MLGTGSGGGRSGGPAPRHDQVSMLAGTPLCSGVRSCCVSSATLPAAVRSAARSAPSCRCARWCPPEEQGPQ
eukprot:13444385-Alexandrium_andersonii.AAC.1